MARRSGGRSMLRLMVLLFGLGSITWAFLLDEEPAAFGRIRSFSAKVQRRAMEAAAARLAEEQAAERTERLAALPDLLGRFGSWDPSRDVQHVFALPDAPPEEPAAALPATPAGPLAVTADPGPLAANGTPDPVAPSPDAMPSGLPDPPAHRVSLIMLGGEVARAVVDNAVLTLGDRVGDGVLVQIHAHGVVLRGEHGLVAYDVGSDKPRRISDQELQATQDNMGAGR